VSPSPEETASEQKAKPSLWVINKSAKWDTQWWKDAGYCVRYAPSPGSETRAVYPRIVHGRLDGCGDGEIPKEDENDEAVLDATVDLTVQDRLIEQNAERFDEN